MTTRKEMTYTKAMIRLINSYRGINSYNKVFGDVDEDVALTIKLGTEIFRIIKLAEKKVERKQETYNPKS